MPARAAPAHRTYAGGVRFLNDLQPQLDLTYDDVFMVPNRSSVTSRLDVDLSSVDGTGTTIPLVVANMTAIAGRRMAETTARRGALTVIPQDIPAEIVRDVITWQKSRHLVYDTPITLEPTTTVGEALVLLHKRAHGAALVTVGDRPVGIVTETDLTGVDRFTQLEDVMVRDMVALADGVDVESAFDTLSHARRRLAPVVAPDGRLVGILTRAGALRAHLYSPATDDDGRLRVAAAVGINGDVAAKAPTPWSSTRPTATRRRCSRRCARCGRSTPVCRSSRETSSRRRAPATSSRPVPTSSRSGWARARCARRG
jgi:IMP dehydrogenase